MSLQALAEAVGNWPLSQFIVESSWAFPTLETVHVIAIVTVFGTIAIMDLRLLGLASTRSGVMEVSHDTLRWTWGAFVLAVASGGLLLISKAVDYAANPFFLTKMALILVAGVNVAVFHVLTWPKVREWDAARAGPGAARIAAGLSLLLWMTVLFLGRAIGFTLDTFGDKL